MIRGIGLRGAVSINVITMIGIGPLITIPLVLAQLAGSLALIGWIAGAVVALCDGLVWAELSSRYPGSGGTYVYLREIFGRDRWGRLLAFLFNWQFLLYAPCIAATGCIGFASYAGYLSPALDGSHGLQIATALAAGAAAIVLLYRRITAIAAAGAILALVAVVTLLAVTFAGFTHSHVSHAFVLPPHAAFGWGFLAGLGGALYITLYDYVGYSDAALLGDEVRDPHRTIPRAIVVSILLVAALYIALQIGVLAHGVPGGNSQFIASAIVASAWGITAARIVTVLILITAFASIYGNLVGFARIPYAAARDGEFFRMFAHLHPRGQFPDVSLIVIGVAMLAACFFHLDQVIAVLTAGIVLIQGVMQVIALFTTRLRGERAPFRMWLFPVPALVALAGWLYAFSWTGPVAIAFGTAWLAAGVVAYLVTARVQMRWPFAVALATAFFAFHPAPAQAAAWPGAAVVQRNGYPVFTVGGKPFFVYGAAFFYERIPRDQWQASLALYRALGINTIDLYVMWNWHEPCEGCLDFTGRTNARRDFAGLLRLIDRAGMRIVLRPGPVIRNEWRNGGYPDWLLKRPEYNMPLRDILEGRYPATATLQNQHSDDAAAEWMRNATHMRYAAQWLRDVLRAAAPWRRDVIAIALDDDQGAYLDNQTWPAPHFQKYIRFLASVVRGQVGPNVPLFINTYDMKVTAWAPVWAWGNWYQSDAYSIGDHDRSQLEFSTGLIATQLHMPVMISEFQAGWLQDADQAWPRSADPSNTTLALHTLLQQGAHGVVNFPVQDTLNPAGWEAPWANAFYSWDAALSLQLTHQPRWLPTARFGRVVRDYGPLLAQMHVKADAAIAYTASAFEPAIMKNAMVYSIAQATMDQQRLCLAEHLTCVLIDLRYTSLADLRRYKVLIIPENSPAQRFIAPVHTKLASYVSDGGRIVSGASEAATNTPAAGGIASAVLLADPNERYGFLSVVNYSSSLVRVPSRILRGAHFVATTPSFSIPARDAALVPVAIPGSALPPKAGVPREPALQLSGEPLSLRPGSSIHVLSRSDAYSDGYPTAELQNSAFRLIISKCAGARAFVLEYKPARENLVTTVGAFRDAWLITQPASSRDYIARYTHPIATGTFNRCYSGNADASHDTVELRYKAADAAPSGATFSKSFRIVRNAPIVTVKTTTRFLRARNQRAQQLTSFALTPQTQILRVANGYGLYDPIKHRVFEFAWPTEDVQAHTLDRHDRDALLTLTFSAGGTCEMRLSVSRVSSISQAQAALSAFAKLPPLPKDGGVAER